MTTHSRARPPYAHAFVQNGTIVGCSPVHATNCCTQAPSGRWAKGGTSSSTVALTGNGQWSSARLTSFAASSVPLSPGTRRRSTANRHQAGTVFEPLPPSTVVTHSEGPGEETDSDSERSRW